ncbi:CtsR family transcriptional regulator [Sporomusa malonica]|uniref:Transcriptional regulator CtsR n=1 Tax=Sporomusa malonica TaxID=112901 RepID=A0A1W2EYN0_9FIRM|nr:CtsR family transcriptional regulator [Sporomusa malonica]SMD14336.1 transcriptional regulator CtsR [Sporomusa malonica]
MNNLADIIEQWILRQIAHEQDEIIILRRNEMAEELACAPSQISYVLSTRFTIERGFIVESRRGSGGFVRIARIPVQSLVYQDAASQIDSSMSLADIKAIVTRLRSHNLMTSREAALIYKCFAILYERLEPEERAPLLQSLLMTLANQNE